MHEGRFISYPLSSGLNRIKLFKVWKLILITIITVTNAKPNAKPHTHSHRCLDWNFGGWSPMFYTASLQPSVSAPIYHRSPLQIHQTASELHHLTSKQNSANYIKKLRPPPHSWLPYFQSEEAADKGQAKLISYNVRKPSKYRSKYPRYPQYLPITVLNLKKAKKQSSNNYQVPIKATNYAIKRPHHIYSSQPPIIYEQLDYQLSNQHHINKYPNGYSISQSSNYQNKPQYQQPQSHYPKKKKTTVAAYIPVVQVPAIEHIRPKQLQKPRHHLPNLNQQIKKPIGNYEEKIIEEHIYQIPNHLLHELRHEMQSKPMKNIYSIPSISSYSIPIGNQQQAKLPTVYQHLQYPKISHPISHVHQSFGPIRSAQPHYVEMPTPPPPPPPQQIVHQPQISYEINQDSYNANHHNNDYKQQYGPPAIEMPYQMDNYAKAEDAGLFKPLLDQISPNYPKIGAIPYKDNDPENLNVIHLIANQRHLPLVVPITSIHTSNDGSYPIGHNEVPIMEKVISSYSERPLNHQKQQQYSAIKNEDYGIKIEQEKNGYIEDEKVILEQLKQPAIEQSYKEQQNPQYLMHQAYGPISSIPDVPLPPAPELNYQISNHYQQQIEQVKGNEYAVQQQDGKTDYPVIQVQQDYKANNYPIQQQQEIKSNDYSNEQIKEQPITQPITQIQQITTEYVKQEEPNQIIQQQTDSYNNQAEQTPVQVQEFIIKDNYPTQDYKIKGVEEEYGRRVPNTNYQYVKPNNLQVNYNSYDQQQQTNDQGYSQQQQQIESQKIVQHDSLPKEQLDERANIAAYEEARKSILQPISYASTSYNQPQSQSYEQQDSYQQQQQNSYEQPTSYQPPLSTYETKEKSIIDYTDDYPSNTYDNSGSNYKTESEKISDKVYDLPSNTAEKVISSTNNGYNTEILTSEEQTNKKNYETLPVEVKSVVVEEEKPIVKQLVDAKSESGQKYGERLVYVKSSKFKNLRTVNGNTYLGDTLLYSASTRSNFNSTVRRSAKKQAEKHLESEKVFSRILNTSTSSSVSSIIAPIETSASNSFLNSPILLESNSPSSNKSDVTSSTLIEQADSAKSNKTIEDDEKVVNYVKPISRSALRNLRIRKLRKESKLDEQLAASASEQIESKLLPADVIDLTNLNADDLKDNLKSDSNSDLDSSDSQLFHAYYGPPDHQPESGYVKLTVQQFKEIFKDAEIHVLNQNLNQSQSSTPSILDNSSSNLSSTTIAAQI